MKISKYKLFSTSPNSSVFSLLSEEDWQNENKSGRQQSNDQGLFFTHTKKYLYISRIYKKKKKEI